MPFGFGLLVAAAMGLIFFFTQRGKGMGGKSTAVQNAAAAGVGLLAAAAFVGVGLTVR